MAEFHSNIDQIIVGIGINPNSFSELFETAYLSGSGMNAYYQSCEKEVKEIYTRLRLMGYSHNDLTR